MDKFVYKFPFKYQFVYKTKSKNMSCTHKMSYDAFSYWLIKLIHGPLIFDQLIQRFKNKCDRSAKDNYSVISLRER